jgi:hypothetical protein
LISKLITGEQLRHPWFISSVFKSLQYQMSHKPAFSA